MKVMLTSFGIERGLQTETHSPSIFYHMPPVSYRNVNSAFMPDYEILLLCEKIIMDGSSYEWLVERPYSAYCHVADTFRALNSEGYIELVDFTKILRDNTPILEKMVDHDLKALDQWIDPLREALDIWQQFALKAADVIRAERNIMYIQASHAFMHETHHMDVLQLQPLSSLLHEALESSRKRRKKEHREALR